MRGPRESFRDSQEVDKNPFKFLTPDFPKLDRVRGRGVLGTKEVRGYNVSPLQAESSTGWGQGWSSLERIVDANHFLPPVGSSRCDTSALSPSSESSGIPGCGLILTMPRSSQRQGPRSWVPSCLSSAQRLQRWVPQA